MSGSAVRGELETAGFNSEMILANVRKLRKLVSSLEWAPETEGWTGYSGCTHVGRDREAKSSFLQEMLANVRPATVVDLGANDGHFSLIAVESGAHAVAVDGDEAVLDGLYRRSRGLDLSPVLADLTNPAPAQGWAGMERPGLFDRLAPDLVIAFGVIHHLIYTSSVPPRAVVEWLRTMNAPVALEFVAPHDEMVVTLTSNKVDRELHPGRDEAGFRLLVAEHFDIVSEQTLGDGSRVLFALRPR
jgi:hypothetical protein